MKFFYSAVLVLSLAPIARGELVMVDERDNDGVELFRLTVTPAPEPTPAFKHRFVSPIHKLKHGNAAAFYRRIHAENHVSKSRTLNDEFGDGWSDWTTARAPLSQVPLEDLRRAASIYGYEVDNGARAGADCLECDWGFAVEELRGLETIEFLLPEFQEMRGLTRGTSLHTRLAIAEQRYADAIDLMRINYRMARDTGKVPFLVCALIGCAQAGITNNNALDLMAAPGSPNLYWALAELPDPIVPIREALRFEMGLGLRVFPMLEDAETAVRAPEEWNRLFSEAQAIFPGLIGGRQALRDRVLASYGGVVAGALGYTHAKQRLVDWGFDPDRVEAMAVGQVLAIYSARVYVLRTDAMERSFYVPYPEARRLGREADQLLEESGPLSDDPNREIMPIANLLLPAVNACRDAEMRVRRETALLRAIEAVRMHAAEAGGLPESLADVTCVPVPNNPATKRAFDYELDDGTAVFMLPESEGIHRTRRYEIRLAE